MKKSYSSIYNNGESGVKQRTLFRSRLSAQLSVSLFPISLTLFLHFSDQYFINFVYSVLNMTKVRKKEIFKKKSNKNCG
jgi:hypothetical protein